MRVVWGVLMLLLLLAGCVGNSSLGNHLRKSSSDPASSRRMSNTPHSQGGVIAQSNTANTRIVDSKARNPHAKPKSPADSKVRAERHALSATESSFSSEPCSEQALKASSGRGDCQGGRERLRNLSPSPLDEKKTESDEANQTLEAKALVSEKVDSESEIRAESAMAGDSEKRGLESTTDSESKNQTEDSNNQDSPPTNDINTPLANTTESDEEVQEDGQTYRAHISYKKGSKIKHGREILYYLNGTIAKQSFYLNGRLEGKVEIFSQKGVLIYEAHYRAGQLNGLCKIYDVASGRLKSEMNFKNGLQEGQMSVYDSSGKLWHRLEYKQGKRDGIAIEYDDSGKILRQTHYIDDKEAR